MITVRYFAAARAAAACESEQVPLSRSLDRAGLVALLTERHPEPPAGEPALATVLEQSSLLVDGRAMRGADVVASGARVDVLPPFSGG